MNGRFPALAMQAWNQGVKLWAATHGRQIKPIHNSEPEPLSTSEFEQLTGASVNALVNDISLGYAPDDGTWALRSAVAESLPGLTADQVISTAGAQEALTLVLHALLKKNDKAVVITPVFEPILRLLQGLEIDITAVPLALEKQQWRLDLDSLFSAMGSHCKVLVVNFPHNPTGMMVSPTHWQAIVSQCEKHGTWLVSDEVFRGLEQNPSNTRLAPAAVASERGISIGVTAKSLALPGVRVGWLSCQDSAVRQKVLAIKQYFSICNSQLDEAVATAAIRNRTPIWQRSAAIVAENVRSFEQALNAAFAGQPEKKPNVILPQGGCTGFVPLGETAGNGQKNDDAAFCRFVLEKTGFNAYPGQLFASQVPGFRLGFGYRRFARDYAPLAEALAQWRQKA